MPLPAAFSWRHFWSLLGLVLKVCSGLVVLPLALRSLSVDHMAVLYVFQSLVAIAPIIDFSFSPNIGRAISFFNAGGKRFIAVGMAASADAAEPNFRGLLAVITLQRKILKVGAILVAIAVVFLAFIIIDEVRSLGGGVFWSAVMFASAAGLNIYTFGATAILSGAGHVACSNAYIVVGALTNFLISGLALALGAGVAGLAMGLLAGSVVTLALARLRMSKLIKSWTIGSTEKAGLTEMESGVSLKTFWPNTWRSATVGLGGYLIYQSQILVSNSALSSREIASLGLSLQVVTLLTMAANVFVSVHLPSYVELRARGKLDELLCLFSRDLLLGCGMYIGGGVVLCLAGPFAIALLGSNTQLISGPQLMFLVGYRFLEYHHVQYANLVCTENRMPFVFSSIISGVFILLFGFVFSQLWGLWGVLLAPAVVQLAGNNWYPIYLALKYNSWTWSRVMKSAIRQIGFCYSPS